MDTWVTPPEPVDPVRVPETLWSVAMRLMDPRPPRSVVEEKVQSPDYPTEIPRALVEGIVAHLKDGIEGCHHAVNECQCELIAVVGELELALKGEMTCGECHGDTFVFDEATYQNALANRTDEERNWAPEESLGHVNCPVCRGAGVVRMEVCQK